AHGHEVHLCCPSLPRLWVYESDTKQVKQYDFPHANPEVYGGFAAKGSPWIYFYDTRAPGILKWNATSHSGTFHPCPYTLSGTLYMTFLGGKRKEIWGSTYTGNDLVRFDLRVDQWTGQWKCPLEKATPTPADEVFGDTLYLSDHLNGRLVPFNAKTGKWGEPIALPGYGEWFGYVSGGWVHRGLIYCCHSTWVGGNDSIDGKPHHFLGTWTVFDPKTGKLSRLDFPVQGSEDFMSDYAATVKGQLYLLAVNSNPPYNAVILSTSTWDEEQ
ncbi:MAG: hypothetical protein HY318_02995, partial [Armatimonadetes bacterium]|nr:hypothetical protein [Armatimonadota bacterium]